MTLVLLFGAFVIYWFVLVLPLFSDVPKHVWATALMAASSLTPLVLMIDARAVDLRKLIWLGMSLSVMAFFAWNARSLRRRAASSARRSR